MSRQPSHDAGGMPREAGGSVHRLRAAVVCNPDLPHLDAMATLESQQPARGIATSGWRGRSFSLGIADAVTVLAETAAQADAAATIIANAPGGDGSVTATAGMVGTRSYFVCIG